MNNTKNKVFINAPIIVVIVLEKAIGIIIDNKATNPIKHNSIDATTIIPFLML